MKTKINSIEEMEEEKDINKLNEEVPGFEYRMYSFVPRHLSSIQKGIQTTHAVVEYGFIGKDDYDFNRWSSVDKTIIILDSNIMDMVRISDDFDKMGLKYGIFCEPDLCGIETSLVFLADSRVWNKKLYPDFKKWLIDKVKSVNEDDLNSKNINNTYNIFDNIIDKVAYDNLKKEISLTDECDLISKYPKYYNEWVSFIGGDCVLYKREIIRNARLAV